MGRQDQKVFGKEAEVGQKRMKVDYCKFGSLLAKVATVHGQKAEGL
jgi:hypothetical protein